MYSKEEIKKLLRSVFPDLKQKYAVSELRLFGSYLNGHPREDSDVDLLVNFAQEIYLIRFVQLQRELTAYLQSPVDLVTPDALKARIKDDIITQAEPI